MSAVPTGDVVSGAPCKPYFVFVAPEFRRKGITKLLLERVCQDAVDDGLIMLRPTL